MVKGVLLDLSGVLYEGNRPVPGALVVGDAGTHFTYDALNAAFRILADGAAFYALAANRTFYDADGALSMDVGAFVAALEYASGQTAEVLGKPAEAFFRAAPVSYTHLRAHET